MSESFWIISTNTKEKKKVQKLLKKVLDNIGIKGVSIDFKTHHETKLFYGEFRLTHEHSSKADTVFQVIKYGQSIGYYWQLFGSIETQPVGRSEDSNISGITSMEWHVEFD